MRLPPLCMLAVLAVMTTSPSWADTQSCRDLSVKAPSTILDIPQTSVTHHEDTNPGSGIQIRYVSEPTHRVSLIFYDDGHTSIPSWVLQDHWQQSTQVIGIVAQRRGIDVSNSKHGTLKDADVLANVSLVHMNSGPNEYLAIGMLNDCLVKLRISLLGTPQETDQAFLGSVLSLDAFLRGQDL